MSSFPRAFRELTPKTGAVLVGRGIQLFVTLLMLTGQFSMMQIYDRLEITAQVSGIVYDLQVHPHVP